MYKGHHKYKHGRKTAAKICSYSRTPDEWPPSPTTIPLIRPHFVWRTGHSVCVRIPHERPSLLYDHTNVILIRGVLLYYSIFRDLCDKIPVYSRPENLITKFEYFPGCIQMRPRAAITYTACCEVKKGLEAVNNTFCFFLALASAIFLIGRALINFNCSLYKAICSWKRRSKETSYKLLPQIVVVTWLVVYYYKCTVHKNMWKLK